MHSVEMFSQQNTEFMHTMGTNMDIKTALHVLILLLVVHQGQGQDAWTDTRTAYEDIYLHYYNDGTSLTDIVPVVDQSTPMYVTMTMSLSSLNGFDAVKGQMDISGSMLLEWSDEVVFQTYLFGNVTEVLIDYDKAWSPSIVLVNAVDTVKNIGDTTYKLRYLPGENKVQWQPRVLLRASCAPDVTYYPFDRQVCDFTYTAWGHTSEEIRLLVPSAEWDTSLAENNGVWKIIRLDVNNNSRYYNFCHCVLVIYDSHDASPSRIITASLCVKKCSLFFKIHISPQTGAF